MKFNVSSKKFYNAASAVSKVINNKNTLTILDNFLITLDGDTLHITGSDVENALEARIPVMDAEGSGSICVGARRLVDLLKEIPDQGVTVNIDDSNIIKLEYSSGTYDFVGIDGSEYPAYKKDEDDVEQPITFSCPVSVLAKGFDYTLFAISGDDYRPAMMGVHLDIKRDSIIFASTDTRKLVKYVNSSCQPGVEASCIVPAKQAGILRSVFGADAEVKVSMTTKSATFETETLLFNCRFINSVFPDYNRVIPVNNNLELTVDRQLLLNAVRRVGLFVAPGYGLIKIKITPDKMELVAQDSNLMTSAREKVPCSFTGEQMVIGFSAPFLTEILNTLKSSDVVINLCDPARPGIFRPSEKEDDAELIMLLMPMTVGEF
jgi:DNA polymerase-3 subunit beta